MQHRVLLLKRAHGGQKRLKTKLFLLLPPRLIVAPAPPPRVFLWCSASCRRLEQKEAQSNTTGSNIGIRNTIQREEEEEEEASGSCLILKAPGDAEPGAGTPDRKERGKNQ